MISKYSITVLDSDWSEMYMETYDNEECFGFALADFYGCGYAKVRETCNRAVVKVVSYDCEVE